MRNLFLSVLTTLSLANCGGGGGAPLETPATEAARRGTPQANIAEILQYKDLKTTASEDAKIFLIAGGSHNANFAQEVIDQKHTWLTNGFTEDEIACYYAIPMQKEFQGDEEQYRALATELKDCYPADPGRVFGDIKRAGKKNGEFVYVYATSHGGEPMEYLLDKPQVPAEQKQIIQQNVRVAPFLNQYLISMDVLPDGTTANFNARLQFMMKHNSTPDEHLFTPRYLKAALSVWPRQAQKVVTIQACHSGGFLDSDREKFKADTLKGLTNITVMTASRHDRSSFGCQPGVDRTLYGQVYTQSLEGHKLRDMPSMEWEFIHQDIARQIEELESKMRGVQPSMPQFYSSEPVATADYGAAPSTDPGTGEYGY